MTNNSTHIIDKAFHKGVITKDNICTIYRKKYKEKICWIKNHFKRAIIISDKIGIKSSTYTSADSYHKNA